MQKIEDVFEKYKDDIYLSLFKILNMGTSSLLDPCYNPPIASLFKTNFKNGLWKDISSSGDFDFPKYISSTIYPKVQAFRLYRDETVWYLLLTSLYFSQKIKQDRMDSEIAFMSTFTLLLKYYTSLSLKHMSKFCDKAKAIMALETLSEKALFSGKNIQVSTYAKSEISKYGLNAKIKNGIMNSSIGLGMVYIMTKVMTKYYSKIKLTDFKTISKLIIYYRSRLSQSFKAYARHYYDIIQMKTSDDTSMNNIENLIHQVVNTNSQSMVYISDDHYKYASIITDVPIDILKKLYHVAYQNSDNYLVISNVINIMLGDGRHNELQNIEKVSDWLMIIRSLVALRTKYGLRTMLHQIIESDTAILEIYNSKSDSFKHKLLQGLGSVIALSIYDSIRVRALNNVAYMIV